MPSSADAASRCQAKTTSRKGKTIDVWYSGKTGDFGGNILALMRPDGLPIWVSDEVFYDWHRLCGLAADQPPLWESGTRHGEAVLLYGHLVGELVRRVDGRTPGWFLREAVCGPLGLDFAVGLDAA